MAKIRITDPKKKTEQKPLTYDQYKSGGGDRDFKKNPITAQEWHSMAEEKKKRNTEKADRNERPYMETMIRIRKKK
jgi:hypothetical protein